MALRVSEVRDSLSKLPQRADVVVVGGGIFGVSAALFLAQKNINVVLLEKGVVAGEQSGRNWGWIRGAGRAAVEMPLSIESKRLWREMEGVCGENIGYRQSGILNVAEVGNDLSDHASWQVQLEKHEVEFELLTAAQLRKRFPLFERNDGAFLGALWAPTDALAEPELAVPAMARAAMQHGARIYQNCAVRGLDLKAGRIGGVVTERGYIHCNAMVVAGGAWTRLFCGASNIDLPQLRVLNSVMATDPVGDGPEYTAGGRKFAFRKRLDGGYNIARQDVNIAEITPDSFRLFFDYLPTALKEVGSYQLRISQEFIDNWRLSRRWSLDGLSPFEIVRVLNPPPKTHELIKLKTSMAEVFPFLRGTKVASTWAGLIDVTPDELPVISTVELIPGLVIATGGSGHGFGIGPGVGRVAAELAVGETTVIDPTPFRLDRFKRSRRSLAAL